jgi:hypothetical protein
LSEEPPGTFKICPVCWWEDDDHAVFGNRNRRRGTNRVTLGEAQANYRRIGAADDAYLGRVRPPQLGEGPGGRN